MGRSAITIRPARLEDAGFIARNILSSQRGPFPRGWFDIALGWDEPQCLAFVECIALAAGRAAGFARASISFLIGNAAAERCYAKAGFSFAEEKRDPAFEALTGAPGFRRFVRAI